MITKRPKILLVAMVMAAVMVLMPIAAFASEHDEGQKTVETVGGFSNSNPGFTPPGTSEEPPPCGFRPPIPPGTGGGGGCPNTDHDQ